MKKNLLAQKTRKFERYNRNSWRVILKIGTNVQLIFS